MSGSVGITKVGKLVRLIRLIRLFRISKIYKKFSSRRINKKPTEHVQSDNADESSTKNKSKSQKESKVGRKMSEVATKSVILIVFILLIMLPMFNADFWINDPTAGEITCYQYAMLIDSKFPVSADLDTLTYDENDASQTITNQQAMLALLTKDTLYDYKSQAMGPLLRINFSPRAEYYFHSDFLLYREDQMVTDRCLTKNGLHLSISKKDSTNDVTNAFLSLIRTFSICGILIGGSYLFSNNTHLLVIAPIERMIDRVVALIEKPQQVKEEAFIEEEEQVLKRNMGKISSLSQLSGLTPNALKKTEEETEQKNQELETKYLETAIDKIGVLLGVGLGEAGSELINSYLNRETDILNIADEVLAIFGFFDIRNFTDATEVLQEEVMVFVNVIADIIHTTADKSLGAANKNVGDAFLIVWREGPKDEVVAQGSSEHAISLRTNLADLALYSLLCMYLEIGRAYQLKKFVDNPKMKERIGKNFRIRLGFGLHYGWAIEGALGSHYKVDVTYLSPHVNMAARLEGDTKKYGVPILLSGEMYDILSPFVRAYCRLIDQVSDGHTNLRLYTPLVTDKTIRYTDVQAINSHILQTKERFLFKKIIRSEIEKCLWIGKNIFQHSLEISLLTCGVPPALAKTFKIAYDLFKGGHWPESLSMFDAVLKLDPEDGPTKFIFQYILERKASPPDDWIGVRIDNSVSH